jgi:hypothetical protein
MTYLLKNRKILFAQIALLCFCVASSCKNESKKHENHIVIQEPKLLVDVPTFKNDSTNLTLKEYSAMLSICCNLRIKGIITINSKGFSDTSIILKVEPKPYSTLEQGDSVLVYVN